MKIDTIICETHTGILFDNAIMVCVRLFDGSYADYLFNREGEPMDTTSPEAKAIINYYQKSFDEIQIHP